MQSRRTWAIVLGVVILAVWGGFLWQLYRPELPEQATRPVAKKSVGSRVPTSGMEPLAGGTSLPAGSRGSATLQTTTTAEPEPLKQLEGVENKVQRLAMVREIFTGLAMGDRKTALEQAKLLEDPTEREAALMALLTIWKNGDIGSPRRRAALIEDLGLEAGLGMELLHGDGKDPKLAALWASVLTEGEGRADMLTHAAAEIAVTDPTGALALGEQLTGRERDVFLASVIGAWGRTDPQAAAQYLASVPAGRTRTAAIDQLARTYAMTDTDGALAWARQLTDVNERQAALGAIDRVAPVGIGATLSWDRGGLVVNDLVPNAPAARSGQIGAGDRIIGVAQGNNSFVDVRSMPMQQVIQMVRGNRGTVVQLQIVPADAPPNTPPKIVSIVRDQVKHKEP